MRDFFNKIRSKYKVKDLIKNFIILWLIYALITGAFAFIIHKEVSPEYEAKSAAVDFYSDTYGPDRGILIDDPLTSGVARLAIVRGAEKTLNVAYFAIEAGETPNLFFASLLDAADRGVQVNLLLDGIFHGINKELRPMFYIFSLHPNMNLKFYEPLNPLMPWTFNNRMHDKFIIADNNYAIIGGRNIGDRFFAPEWHDKRITNDRDIIIFNTLPGDESSVINQMSAYFDELWSHKYSRSIHKNILQVRYLLAVKKGSELKEKFTLVMEHNKEVLDQPVDLMELSFPTHKISLIHNPITRFSKEPWCWYELTRIMKNAQKSIFIQSPYVILSQPMQKGYLNKEDFADIDVTILTNSMGNTFNIPAFSSYLNHRKKIVDNGVTLYEYQAPDSLHTKTFAIDDDLLALGSFNLDPRSSFLSTESMVVIHSPEAVTELKKGLTEYMEASLEVGRDYSYKQGGPVDAIIVHPFKKFALTLLSYLARLFEYLF